MNNQIKSLLSIGAAIVASPLFRTATQSPAIMHDPLSLIGLERRSTRVGERTALIGLGLLLGAGAALLMAPSSGPETRKKLKGKVEDLTKEARQLAERASEYVADVTPAAVASLRNGGASPHVSTPS